MDKLEDAWKELDYRWVRNKYHIDIVHDIECASSSSPYLTLSNMPPFWLAAAYCAMRDSSA